MDVGISGGMRSHQVARGGTAPPQIPLVPRRFASTDELRAFVDALPLPPYQRGNLTFSTDNDLRHFVAHFRIRGIDPKDEGACVRFAEAYIARLGDERFMVDPFVNDPDPYGMTPVMCAIRENDSDLVRELLRKGAHIDAKTVEAAIRDDDTPDELIKSLVTAALGDIDYEEENARLLDSLCLLADRNRQLAIDCIRLPQATEWINFHYAARSGNTGVIPLLKAAGADPNALRNRVTPLICALKRGGSCGAMVEALLKAGADPNITARGRSPLDVARELDLKSEAMMLVRYKAASNATVDAWINSPDDES